jgi:hypothetical protein
MREQTRYRPREGNQEAGSRPRVDCSISPDRMRPPNGSDRSGPNGEPAGPGRRDGGGRSVPTGVRRCGWVGQRSGGNMI